MNINTNDTYKVTKYVYRSSDVDTFNLGFLTGSDVKNLIKGYTFDDVFEMYFSNACTIGYEIKKA